MSQGIILNNSGSIDTSNLNATANNVLNGKTFIGAGSETAQTGTMANYAEQNVDYSTADIDNGYFRLRVPNNGYYDTKSYLRIKDVDLGDSTQSDVLSGKTFTSLNGIKVQGTMTNNGSVSETLDTTTTSYTVPAGYHDGTGTVSITTQTKSATPSTTAQTISPDSGKVLSSVSVGAVSLTGDATAANVLYGKKFYKDSLTQLTGSMNDYGSYTQFDTTGTPMALSSNSKIGIAPSSPGYYGTSCYITVASNKFGGAKTSEVLSGKTFTSSYGLNTSGTMTDKSGTSSTTSEVSGSGTSSVRFKIPANGYYDTNSYITAGNGNFGTAAKADVLDGKLFTSSVGLVATGTMPNLNTNTPYQVSSSNETKVVRTSSAVVTFPYSASSSSALTTKYLGVVYASSGPDSLGAGYVPNNTVFAADQEKIAGQIGINSGVCAGPGGTSFNTTIDVGSGKAILRIAYGWACNGSGTVTLTVAVSTSSNGTYTTLTTSTATASTTNAYGKFAYNLTSAQNAYRNYRYVRITFSGPSSNINNVFGAVSYIS